MMSREKPTVSVLIATYNKADALKYAIESVLWQTFENFELLVIGDGCTDHSEKVVAAFDDTRVHWHNLPENTGDQSEPHNEGLRRSNGKYIAYLNHDDIWLPQHLEMLVEYIEREQADFAYSIMEWIYPDALSYPVIPDYPDAPLPPEATQTMHRKDIINEIGYWRRPWECYSYPRADYFRRAQFIGKKFVLVPMLSALKFGVNPKDYSALTIQPKYMDIVRNDPYFAEKELGKMLANAIHELDNPIKIKRLREQYSLQVKRKMAKRAIDPARIRFWVRPGKRMRDWAKHFGLDSSKFDRKSS
ncbi:MAG: glycosyltransferase family 2 protein [Anaerolineales bacterium]|nr:glycosyltransferase family 2 protein [Chloroflexota bacterium]MBL6980985.1 glycosyltransferase family 2 protein [Anaerolineales bacterium]